MRDPSQPPALRAGPPTQRAGPLAGVRFVEFAGIGPVPFAGMVLADLGAQGIRLDRPSPGPLEGDPARMPTNRGRPGVAIDLKHPESVAVALRLIQRCDVLLEGHRPDVMERLGLGPDVCLEANPRLIYARMTGWGQRGPLAGRAGHDLTYLAIAGALHHIGRSGQPPTPPLNLIADYGGGGMLMVVGVLAALLETSRSGRGQVVDAAMVDGVALLMASIYGLRGQGLWRDEPGANLLDSGAPFYDVYRCADGGYVAVAALEPQFFAALIDGLGLDPASLPEQYDVAGWPRLRTVLAEAFARRTRDEWAQHFRATDACVAPVLPMGEAATDAHMRARNTFIAVNGMVQPAPAPRFARTPAGPPEAPGPPAAAPTHLLDWGFGPDEIDGLVAVGALSKRLG